MEPINPERREQAFFLICLQHDWDLDRNVKVSPNRRTFGLIVFPNGVASEIKHMKNENPWIDISPGIKRQTITSGKTMYQMMAKLDAGSRMPEHKHPQEQIVHILEGRMKLIVSGVPRELKGGESFYLASNVPHGVETIVDTMVLDTFSPPRDDYLALDKQASVQ
jgi:quercetin dioxygenase-like cupin family protein